MCGITLTAENVGKLLSKGKTDLIKGFTSHKSGKNFDAYLVFNATSGRITYDFPPRK
jgi:DNA topoisomerase-3